MAVSTSRHYVRHEERVINKTVNLMKIDEYSISFLHTEIISIHLVVRIITESYNFNNSIHV